MIDVINIIFRFFDFFVIIGLVFYAVRYYVIPTVEKMVREHGVFIYNLESDCRKLQLQTQSIYENFQDQDREFKSMQENFKIWHKKCEERSALQLLEQEQIDIKMHNRFEIRSDFLQNDMLIKQELPVVLDKATKLLQLKYDAIDAQKQYIDTLIHVMKEQS